MEVVTLPTKNTRAIRPRWTRWAMSILHLRHGLRTSLDKLKRQGDRFTRCRTPPQGIWISRASRSVAYPIILASWLQVWNRRPIRSLSQRLRTRLSWLQATSCLAQPRCIPSPSAARSPKTRWTRLFLASNTKTSYLPRKIWRDSRKEGRSRRWSEIWAKAEQKLPMLQRNNRMMDEASRLLGHWRIQTSFKPTTIRRLWTLRICQTIRRCWVTAIIRAQNSYSTQQPSKPVEKASHSDRPLLLFVQGSLAPCRVDKS